jgi:hypothetical protein
MLCFINTLNVFLYNCIYFDLYKCTAQSRGRPTEKPAEVIPVASVLREVFFYFYSWGEPSSFVTLTTNEPIV